jgi:anti-sigma factor RsiW
MTATEHLSLEQVRAYVRGALHPSTLVATDDHLEACAACRAALARESDASFGAEAFGRALAAPEARPESPHASFEHLRGAVDGTLSSIDRQWVEAHVRLCVMCAEELNDLERFATVLPVRPVAVPSSGSADAADVPPPVSSHDVLVPSRPRLPRLEPDDEPPARYGETAPPRLPLWIKVAAGASLLAIVQLWAC